MALLLTTTATKKLEGHSPVRESLSVSIESHVASRAGWQLTMLPATYAMDAFHTLSVRRRLAAGSRHAGVKAAATRYQSMMALRPLVGACSWRGSVASHERTAVENELRRVVDTHPGFVWTALPDGSTTF